MKHLFFFSACAACLLSCASVTRRSIIYVNLTDASRFALLPPGGIERDMDMVQSISAEFGDRNFFLNAWVRADENGIDMVFFNEMGASIGELSYRDGAARFSSTVFPVSLVRSFRPEYIVADFQLSFYDPVLLNRSLRDGGLVLETQDGNRRILSGSEVIIEIEKTHNTVKLVNHFRGYTLILEGDFHYNE